jgi:hypothetical protein
MKFLAVEEPSKQFIDEALMPPMVAAKVLTPGTDIEVVHFSRERSGKHNLPNFHPLVAKIDLNNSID